MTQVSHSLYVYLDKIFYYSLDQCKYDKVVVSRTDKRSYTSFSSIESFITWYTSVPVAYRCFDEVLIGDRKFMLDIDCKDNISNDQWNDVIYYCRTQIMSHFPTPNIMLYTSHGEDKKSCHMIVSNYVLDYDSCYSVAFNIYNSLPMTISKYIDLGIYKRVQQMRLEGSRKSNSNRYLYLDGHNDIYDLKLSMLGCTDGLTKIKYHKIIRRANVNNISIRYDKPHHDCN